MDRHNLEIQYNLSCWKRKKILRLIYRGFHEEIARHINRTCRGAIVEIGSGIGNIQEIIPDCLRTDLFPNSWIDRIENAYSLSFESDAVSNLILFDVFHHLQFPGTALQEFYRVLAPRGRLILFEPCISLLGRVIFGFFHHEPLGAQEPIEWFAPPSWIPENTDYYGAQANATRIFLNGEFKQYLNNWNIVEKKRFSAISYIASGGYSKPQLYPEFAYPAMRLLEKICDLLPLFATRLLIVLEKQNN